MFSGNFIETDMTVIRMMECDGQRPISCEAFEVVLKYIYCGIDSVELEIDGSNVFAVFVGARYYELDCLCNACEVCVLCE